MMRLFGQIGAKDSVPRIGSDAGYRIRRGFFDATCSFCVLGLERLEDSFFDFFYAAQARQLAISRRFGCT